MRNPREASQEREAKKEAQQKKMDAEYKRVRGAARRVANTESGRLLIKHLMQECGFLKPSLTVDPNTTAILVNNTLHNEALRGLYLNLRNLLTDKQLIAIEFNTNKESEDDES